MQNDTSSIDASTYRSVDDTSFDESTSRFVLKTVSMPLGSTTRCPICGAEQTVYIVETVRRGEFIQAIKQCRACNQEWTIGIWIVHN